MRRLAFKTFGDIYGFEPEFMDTTYPMNPLWKENDEQFTLELVIPGAENDDIKVEMVDQKLIVSFDGNEYRRPFSYEYLPPKETKNDDITAKCKSGIVNIYLKKKKVVRKTIKVE